MSFFTCPICHEALSRQDGRCLCPRGHSYDLSREGYVHLLPANRKHAKEPGDDRAMVSARTRFLDGGWYAHLREALCEAVLAVMPRGGTLLDCGCGEGYYTEGIADALRAQGREAAIAGVDISKYALKKAARRCREAEFAVASVYHLPVRDGSADVLLNCFSPLAIDEFRRVLKKGGTYLYVVPAADHLMEMKQVLYDRPYPNEETDAPYEGFSAPRVTAAHAVVRLDSSEAIMALFGMTPYAWKTPKEGVERLRQMTQLDVTAAFRILTFQKL